MHRDIGRSYVEPSDVQMPLSFAHAHASDNWRISVRGTTNMGRDTYEQGQFRFHDGGVPYASDNFAWGPEGGYGIIVFADRRGFAILPVKAEIAERVTPAQEAAGTFLGIDMQNPCPGAPAIATTMGPTVRSHLDGGFDTSEQWDEIAPGVRMAAGLAGEPTGGPVLVFLNGAAGTEVLPIRSIGSETIVAPVSGSMDARWYHADPGRRARRGSRHRPSRRRRRPRRRAAGRHRRGPAGAALGARRRDGGRAVGCRPVDGARRAPEPAAPRRLPVLIAWRSSRWSDSSSPPRRPRSRVVRRERPISVISAGWLM